MPWKEEVACSKEPHRHVEKTYRPVRDILTLSCMHYRLSYLTFLFLSIDVCKVGLLVASTSEAVESIFLVITPNVALATQSKNATR